MNLQAMLDQAQACEDAGFTQAAAELKRKADCAKRAAYAYEHYRYVSPEKFKAFNDKLKAATFHTKGAYPSLYHVFDTLKEVPIETYGQVPPADVLAKVAEVKASKVFDTLEVAKIESVREYKDPIVFGRIEGCDDRFFITQWDTDVSIDQIIGENEG